MTHLKIEQNNIPENVTPNTIEKLYSTVTANDYVYDDDDLKGTLQTTSAYEDIVQYLEAKYPGLHINATKLYVRFQELEVLRVLLANNYGDGTGITRTELSAITTLSGTLFQDNTTLTSLDDLQKFTGLTYVNYKFAQGCTNLVSVTFPSNMREIGAPYTDWTSGPFSDCISLQNVTLNEGLTTLGYRAFRNCTALTTINIPSTVTALGIDSSTGSTFESCTGLKTVTGSCILSTLGPYSFYGCNQLESIGDIDISNISTIPYRAFCGCNKLNFGNKLANMPNLTTIGGNAFEGCWLLSNIDLSHVTSITDTYAFRNCIAVTSVDLSSLSSIPNATFEGCTGLTTVTGGSSLTSIGGFGFANCSNLSSIDLSNVTSIGIDGFYNCTSLTSVDLSSLADPGYEIFKGCSNLASVTFSTQLRHISRNMFLGCSSLSGVIDLTNTQVTAVYRGAFEGTNITGLKLPTTVTQYGENWASSPCDGREITTIYGLDNVTWAVGELGAKISNAIYLGQLQQNDSLFVLSSTDSAPWKRTASAIQIYAPKFIYTSRSSNYESFSKLRGGLLTYQNNGTGITSVKLLYFRDLQNLKTFDLFAASIKNLVINNTTPPTFDTSLPDDGGNVSNIANATTWKTVMFGTIPTSGTGAMTIYVPDSAVATYQADSNYNAYTIRGINEINPSTNQPYLARYATNALWEAAGKPEDALIEEYM